MSDVHVPDEPITSDQQPNEDFRGLYMEEDAGLKQTLAGIKVHDLNANAATARPVPVWFLNPEREERRVTYPSITINFTGERVAHEREHRGLVEVFYQYLQDNPFDSLHPVLMEYPIPMDFDYQVTVHTRSNQHMSQISAALMLGPLNPRFGYVVCPGGTIRRLEVLSMTTSNGQESDKRIFRHLFQVRIPTEVEAAVAIGSRVRAVALTVFSTGSQDAISHSLVSSTTGVQITYRDRYSGAQYSTQSVND